MSIEQRLRSGLSSNTEHLSPDLDHELAELLRRTRNRRTRRVSFWVAGVAVATAAAIAWLPEVTESIRSGEQSDVAVSPTPITITPMPVPTGPTDYRRLLEPGEYVLPLEGPNEPSVVVDVSEGFRFDSPWPVFLKKPGDPAVGFIRGVGFWNGDALRIDSDFCDVDSDKGFGEVPGPTLADLAGVLAGQPRLRGTEPVATSVGGYPGLYVEITVPIDPSKCGRGVLWLMGGSHPHDFLRPGFVDRLWILDVAGRRVVIDAFHGPDVSDSEVAELTRIVESSTFLAP